jgi:glycosyltransferase involved in cell wall biosynthesis
MRIAAAWPKPRAERWQLGRSRPEEFPDLSDGLLFLEEEGFDVTIEDSTTGPLNPLRAMHELYSGLDPVRAVRVAARARRYDALVCVGESTAAFFIWLRRLFGLRLPIVLIDPALGGGYARRERLLDFVLPRVERVVVFGRVQLDYLQERYGALVDAVFLHHRADTEFYRPTPGAVATSPCVFSIGNDASRDFDTFAKAARACTAAGDFRHRFVVQTTLPFADPSGTIDVRREPISYKRLRELYGQARVVVIPLFDMRHAGGINALVEAMAMAKPIVVSRSAGIRDYVDEGSTGLVVPPGDAEAMARATLTLLDSEAERKRLGDTARRVVVQRCANRTYARAMADVIRDVVRRPSRRTAERSQAGVRLRMQRSR